MNFDGAKVCGVDDALGNDGCLWPFLDVGVYAAGKLGQVDLVQAVGEAIEGWNRVCGIRLFLQPNVKTAHIVVTQGRIDGPNGTLAISELPCGFTGSMWRQLRQQYDTNEIWTVAENPPAGKIDAVRVIRHEVGHAIGISHIAAGNLMAPTYSTSIRDVMRGDRLEAVDRYGGPRPEASPQPGAGGGEPGAKGDGLPEKVEIVIGGVLYRCTRFERVSG